MSLRDALSGLPDEAQVPVGWVREKMEDGELEPEVITTGQASDLFPAYSEERWRSWAADGSIPDAWQDAEGGPWRLPLASCRSFVRDLQRRGQRRGKRGPTGPWERAS